MSITATKQFITDLLTQVIDPEVGLNIVEMGLVCDVQVIDDVIKVEMTLTTPGCPMGPYITGNVKDVLGQVKGVREIDLQLVWTPAWTPDRIVPEALERLRNGEV